MRYIIEMMAALRTNRHARDLYFPYDREKRRAGTLRLAREIAPALLDNTPTDAQAIRSEAYSTLVVQFCFDSVGVAVSNQEFQQEIDRKLASMVESEAA